MEIHAEELEGHQGGGERRRAISPVDVGKARRGPAVGAGALTFLFGRGGTLSMILAGSAVSGLMLALVALLAGCADTRYYWQSVSGHLALMQAARPVDDWLTDPATAPALLTQCQVLLVELPSAVSGAAPSEEEQALTRA